MRKAITAIMLTMVLSPVVVLAQTQRAAEDCACESQVLPATLAIVNGVTIGPRDLEKSIGDSIRELQQQVIEARKRELDLIINSKLLAAEAAKRSVTTTKLLEIEVLAKVKTPTEAEVQVFYDQNKSRIKDDFSAAKENIVRYLMEERQRLEAQKFAEGLRAASKTTVKVAQVAPPGNDAERAQVLATVNGANITAGDVEDSLKPLISDVQGQIYKLRKNELDLNINDTLLMQEAQKRKITTTALLDAEVKPRQVTEDQARAFFEENKQRVSGDFAQTKDAIVSYLQQTELRVAERAFMEKLRSSATIQVFLEAPQKGK